jgi:hypothetical protein
MCGDTPSVPHDGVGLHAVMKRSDLAHIIKVASEISGDKEIVVIELRPFMLRSHRRLMWR